MIAEEQWRKLIIKCQDVFLEGKNKDFITFFLKCVSLYTCKYEPSCPVMSTLIEKSWTVAHQAPLSMAILARTLEWVVMSSSMGSS